jgi:hypothetical protein
MHSRLHFFGWHRSFRRTAILIVREKEGTV